MGGNNIKTAFRNLTRNKAQSAISILGLGIGLGCIILLTALVVHERSFDRFIPEHKNVYQVMLGNNCSTQYPLAEEMKKDFPEVLNYFRFYQANEIELRNSRNELVKEDYFGFADPSIFKILGIRFKSGMPAYSPSEVAISEKMASKYFGGASPLGKTFTIKLNEEFVVLDICGVYKDFPSTSTLFPEFVGDLKLSEKMFKRFQRSLGDYGSEEISVLNWSLTGFLSYVVLNKNTDIGSLSQKMGKYKEMFTNEKDKEHDFTLKPVADIYLSPAQESNLLFLRSGNPSELKYYEAISFLILLIAVTNYIFLNRAGISFMYKELGTRKVFGASSAMIRRQIILESILITILSLVPAAVVIKFGVTFINTTLNKTLGPDVFSNEFMWILLFLVVFITGLISGLIIGHSVSGIPSLNLLAGRYSGRARPGRLKYSFLILHFTIYVILVVSVLAVSKQIKYSLTNFKGINPENILVSELNSDELKSSFNAICYEMEKVPGVLKVAGTSFIPPFNAYLPVTLATTEGERERFDGLIMGEGMTELLGIEIIDGEPFGPYSPGRRDVIFNESSALKYNVKAGEKYMGFNVKGIVKDFHAHSLHRLIEPMVILQQNPSRMSLLAVRTDGINDKSVIDHLKSLYMQISPDEIFEVRYLTDQINAFYSNERNQGKIIGAFSALALILSIMGLFGISLISVSKKTKEIGIRKVNGAFISEILYLLNFDFVKWVLLSFVISIPASVYIVNHWQDRFAYKTDLSWWIFVLACLSAILVALLTISSHCWKAAAENPVKALRYE